MINKRELRIGSIFEWDNIIFRVESLLSDTVIASFNLNQIYSKEEIKELKDYDPSDTLPYEYLNPIPLCGDILCRCGFKEENGHFIKDEGKELLTITYTEEKQWSVCIDYPLLSTKNNPIKIGLLYLHQLQNVYYILTDKELEFKF